MTAHRRLERWSPRLVGGPYTPPELAPTVIRGFVFDDTTERWPDDHPIQTSPIASADGLTVTTASGSTYLLGEPDPDWVRWLAQQGHDFDPENPIRIKETSA